MRKLLIVLSLLGIGACEKSETDRRHEAREISLTDQIDDLAKETVYFRDHAGVCWGLVWAGGYHGGPAGGPVPGVGPSDACPPAQQSTSAERQQR